MKLIKFCFNTSPYELYIISIKMAHISHKNDTHIFIYISEDCPETGFCHVYNDVVIKCTIGETLIRNAKKPSKHSKLSINSQLCLVIF